MSDNIFSVSDEEWGHYYACQWDRWLEFCGELDKRQRDIYERFYWSADVDRFIRESELAGCKPGLDFDFVIQCNPRRDMNILLNNIKHFWRWVLEDEERRLPFMVSGERHSAGTYFDKNIRSVGGGDYNGMDPEVQVGFFHYIFGQYYVKKNVYPASLGKKNWTPVVLVEPEFMFLNILGALNEALFSPGRMIGSFYSVSLVDYWRSLLCYVNTEILFDTELRMHGKEFNGIKPVALQIEVRRLLAQKEGFDTEDYGVDKVVNRSPEILSKIDAALRNLAGADKYERIMNFIHKYKEDAILASE